MITGSKKLAFLFLTIDNLNQYSLWERFFQTTDPELYSVYVHPKHPDRVSQPLVQKNIIKNLTPTNWGDITIVRALNYLLEEAFEDQENGKFIYCSESCIPLYDLPFIHERLMVDERGYLHSYPHQQRRHRHLRDKAYVTKEMFLKMDNPGWVFNRELVKIILENDHTEVFEDMSVPDENYYINLFQHVGLNTNRFLNNQRLTFANWWEGSPGGGHPKLYKEVTEKDIEVVRGLGFLFFRKVAADANVPSDYILNHQNGNHTGVVEA